MRYYINLLLVPSFLLFFCFNSNCQNTCDKNSIVPVSPEKNELGIVEQEIQVQAIPFKQVDNSKIAHVAISNNTIVTKSENEVLEVSINVVATPIQLHDASLVVKTSTNDNTGNTATNVSTVIEVSLEVSATRLK